MNLIILISFLIFVCVNCELAKQSSELNYVISKPETNILPSISPVNLIKYGPYAGYPIQKLTFGPNMAYNKPILNYINHKHYYPSLPLTINHLPIAYDTKKINSPNHFSHSNELIFTQNKFQHPIVINSNHHLDHLRRNPALIETIHPSDLHMISDHHNYLNPIDHLNMNLIDKHHIVNPHLNGHLIDKHHLINSHLNGHLVNGKHHALIAPHLIDKHHASIAPHLINKHHLINPHLNGHLIDKHHSNGHHIKEHDEHSIIPAPFVYPSAASFVKYANPISHTSYFMKINHVIPETKHHHAYKTELPFFEANDRKLPVQYVNDYGLDPNYHLQNINIKK